MMERYDTRKLKRRQMVVYLRVYERDTGVALGSLVDITRGGLMLVTDEPIELDRSYQLRIDLGEKSMGGRYLDVDARSLWCTPEANPKLFDIGFELVDPNSKTINAIENLVLSLGFGE